MLGFAQRELGLIHLLIELTQSRRRILAIARLQFDVAKPECLETGFSLLEFGFVGLDLLVDEYLGGVGVLARRAETGLDENRNE